MLFILRQLRRLELRKRSGQYFLYAIGEVVLIVVGILIALQIQNWNQGRLDSIEERDLLIELIDNLNQEAERLEVGIEGQEKELEAFSQIREFYDNGAVSRETFETSLPALMRIFGFNPVSSAYDTMKSGDSGFSSRELKSELFQYYEVEQPLLLGTLNRQLSIITNQVEPLFAKHLKSLDYGSSSGMRAVLNDIEDLEFEKSIRGQIILLIPNVNINLVRSQSLLETNRNILAMVEQELENR